MREETVTIRYYKFDELSEDAKARAIEDWRNADAGDNYFSEDVIEDAVEIAKIIGICIGTRRGTRSSKAIYWSGFWSQGDGACFEGSYSFEADAVAKLEADGEWCAEPLRIAVELAEIQARYGNELAAYVAQRGHYSHSGCMSVDVESHYYNDEDERVDVSDDDEESVRQLMRDYADWIYKRLEEAWDWQNSEENISENIRCNEYEFLENGKMA